MCFSRLTHTSFAALLAVVFLATGILLHESGADLALAQYIFHQSGDAFSLRNDFWFQRVFHDGGKRLIHLAFVIGIGALIHTYYKRAPQERKIDAWFILGCATITVIFVGILKGTTTLPCPWSVDLFDGDKPFVPLEFLFNQHIYPLGGCFPAGHAAGIYAWLGAAFIFPLFGKKFWQVFGVIFFVGVLYSVVQNLRGAHFISHDCFSLALSFTVISVGSFIKNRLL